MRMDGLYSMNGIRVGSKVRVLNKLSYKHYGDVGVVTGIKGSYAFVRFISSGTKCKYLIEYLEVLRY